jgi:hypothetical protein
MIEVFSSCYKEYGYVRKFKSLTVQMKEKFRTVQERKKYRSLKVYSKIPIRNFFMTSDNFTSVKGA